MRNALIAAVVGALVASGSAFATAKLIDGHQIKPHSIPLNRLAGKAPRGARGAPGQQGLQGPQGIQGPTGFIGKTTVVSGAGDVLAGEAKAYIVTCPAGTGVISGGVVSDTFGDTWLDGPYNNGWAGGADNVDGLLDGTVTIYALCAQGASVPTGATAHPTFGGKAVVLSKAH